MNCPLCHADSPNTTKFCPYCGAQGSARPSSFKTNIMSGLAGAAPALSSSENTPTLRLAPKSKKLPRKYAVMLERGANPEEVIITLLKANASMRAVLENVVRGISKNEGKVLVELLTVYLKSHCRVCGERLRVQSPDEAGLCLDCAEQ